MPKCSVCLEEKEVSQFSKSQLKKGVDAKCLKCTEAANMANGVNNSSNDQGKICSECKLPNKQFSKTQLLKKEVGKCTDCLEKGNKETSSSPDQKSPTIPSPSKQNPYPSKVKSPTSKPNSSPTNVQGGNKPSLDTDEDVRILCQSCGVYKPKSYFSEGENYCRICEDAKSRGAGQTSLKEHGLLGAGGVSHRKLSWVPENLKDFLLFHEEDSGAAGPEDDEEDGGDEYH